MINKGMAFCRANTNPWEEFFPTLLKALAKGRHTIAVAQKNEDAPAFGRLLKETDCPIATPLHAQYQVYGDRVNAMMRKYLTLWAEKEKGKINPKTQSYKGWGNDQSRYYLKLLGEAEIMGIDAAVGKVQGYTTPLFQTKEGFKCIYRHMPVALAYFDREYPNEMVATEIKTLVVGAVVHRINGVWTTMSVHLTWINKARDAVIFQKDIDAMGAPKQRTKILRGRIQNLAERSSQVMISHGDPKNIKAVEKDVAAVTKRVFTATSKLEIVNLVSEAQVKLFQQTPWERGGGNIPENLGAILFGLKGMKTVKFADGINLFFQSHAEPILTEYALNYPKYVVFDPATTLELEKEAASVSGKDDKKKPEGKGSEKT